MFKHEAEQKLNIVYTDPYIKKRLAQEVDDSEEFVQYVVNHGHRDIRAKELLLKVIVDAIIIESLKFPFSFFTTFSINNSYDNAINGFSMLLKMIARDELEGHVLGNSYVLKQLKKDPKQDFQEAYGNLLPYFTKLMDDAEQQEKDWADYLLQDGAFANFNREICHSFIEYRADLTRDHIGIPSSTKSRDKIRHRHEDFVTWFNKYRNIGDQETSLQEMSNNQYEKGTMENDLDDVSSLLSVLPGFS